MINAGQLNPVESFLLTLQNYTLNSIEIFKGLKAAVRYRKETLQEMYLIGAQSFPIVFLGGLFVGIIMSIEIGYRFETFGAKTMVGRAVALGMVRELGPVITGLLLAARTGAKNATEIGAMQLSEQVDALKAFGVNPIHKLVVPRTVASLIMFLPLTLIADLVGIVAGMIVSDLWMNNDASFFWHSAIYGLQMKDLFVGFLKPVFFGFFIASISCSYGLATSGGNRGLGRATINAVVVSSVVILAVDFIFTKVVWEVL
ncbi:MAG: ABC transporter permease [Ignavibacteriae bacterium]|nr:MAG: ABC transporter permease [Ignavibacteriota bacterium]